VLRATFRNNAVKLVKVRVKVVNVYGYPFHDIDILGEHDDGFEIALDEGCICKGAAEKEWFTVCTWRGRSRLGTGDRPDRGPRLVLRL